MNNNNNNNNNNNPNDSIIENGQNTEKNPGDLRRLAATQTQVKDAGVKKFKEVNNNNNNN